MRITVWNYKRNVISINPARFTTVSSLIKALDMQKYPDEEFYARIEDENRRKEFSFDGSDGLQFIAVLYMRGLSDLIFDMDVPCCNEVGCAMEDLVTPVDEIHLE